MRLLRRGLILHPGALGDVLLALPALAHLAQLAPGIRRTVAVTPRVAGLLEGSAYAEATVEFDRLTLHRLFMTEPEPGLLETLSAHDLIVSWFGAGDPVYRAHLEGLGRVALVAPATPPPGSPRHASRHLLDTLAPLGPPPATLPLVRLAAGDAERGWVAAWLAARALERDAAVVLHPGAGSPAKIWPGYPRLARRLEAAGFPVVAVTGPADAEAAARFAVEAGLAEVRIARDLSLRQLVALFATTRVFVGNDSGLSHLAAAVGCPTLALFGPTDPVGWAPVGARVRVLAGAGAGAPNPWEGIGVDRVAAALLDVPGEIPAGVRISRQSP